jgi:hypothetical protein
VTALAEKNTLAASLDKIPALAFPRRRVPEDEVDTISVPTVVAAAKAEGPVREKIRTQAVMELARNLDERRDELSRRLSSVIPIEVPEKEKGARLPFHAGTTAYLDSTDISWYTLFSDQTWTVWLVGGGLFSIFAAFFGFLKAPKANPMRDFLPRLESIAEQARADLGAEQLKALSDELTDLGDEMAARACKLSIGYDRFAPAQLAYESAHFAIQPARDRQLDDPRSSHPTVGSSLHSGHL